ncbi:MAG: HAMP domain-containing protein [Proteobacteria bacterium]|nr:HAMP domain-containing protein [Pseudomonadota bacterium]
MNTSIKESSGMKENRIPFYRKIIFKVFFLIFFVLVFVLGFNLILTNNMMNERIQQRLNDDFQSAFYMTENFINLVSQTSQMWAKEIVANHFSFQVIKQHQPEEISSLLGIEKNKMSADSIILLDEQGRILAQSGSDFKIGDSLSYQDIVKQTFKSRTSLTKILRERESFIVYSSAIIQQDNKIKGMLLVGYFINDSFVENIKKNTSLEIAFIGNSAVMSSSQWGTSNNLDILPISYLDYQNLLYSPQLIKEIIYKDKVYIVNARKLHNMESLTTGSILFAYPYDKIKQQKSDLLHKKLDILYLSLLIALLIIYIVVRKYLVAISKLTQAMHGVSDNKVYEKINIDSQDEIELLATSFNQMGTELNTLHTNLESEIERKTQELKELNDNLHSLVVSEIEKNRQKEQQLVQQSRLAQMGEMISMIAHQWRQPLAAISSTSMAIHLKAQLNKLDNDTAIELSDKISDYSQHLSTTIDDFREFFKPNKEKQETNYTELVDGVLKIIKVSINNKDIEIITHLNCHKTLYSYPNEIKQVILNLLKNAEDALLEKQPDNPVITIATQDGILTVSDNAGGISEEYIDKIFAPYFSTKTKKDGTGLGLYMSKTIIEEHCGGRLSVSNDKEGAVFMVVL